MTGTIGLSAVTVSVLAAGLAFGGPAAAQAQGETVRRAVPAETTAAAAVNPDWTPPRTPWGQPDLRGIWTSDDMRSVPFARPPEMGTRTELTEAEFEARAAQDSGALDRAQNQETFLRNERGIRTFGYTSMIVDPPDGQVPAMTAAGKARIDPQRDRGTFAPGPFDSVRDDFTLYDRCITRGVIGSILPVLYGNGLRIMQTPDEVVISYEMIHDTRVIPLDGRPPLDPAIRQYMGASRGHFEGDTLVIETTNFTDQTSIGGNGNGPRHSARLHLTERLTRIDPDMIDYRATIDDPVAYTEPFTIRLTISTQPGYEIYEYSCHEGNGAVKYALSGERAYDKAVAKAKAEGKPIPDRGVGSGAIGATVYRPPTDEESVDIGR